LVGTFVGALVGVLVGAGVLHVLNCKLQLPEAQSVFALQFWYGWHLGQPPPQSTSVSCPFWRLSKQPLYGVGDLVGIFVGDGVGEVVGAAVLHFMNWKSQKLDEIGKNQVWREHLKKEREGRVLNTTFRLNPRTMVALTEKPIHMDPNLPPPKKKAPGGILTFIAGHELAVPAILCVTHSCHMQRSMKPKRR